MDEDRQVTAGVVEAPSVPRCAVVWPVDDGAAPGTAEFFPTRGWEIVAVIIGVLVFTGVAAELSGRRDRRERSGRDGEAASGEDGHVAA